MIALNTVQFDNNQSAASGDIGEVLLRDPESCTLHTHIDRQ